MKPRVSYCVGLLVLFGAYAALPQETEEERKQLDNHRGRRIFSGGITKEEKKQIENDRVRRLTEIIDAATALSDIPTNLDTLLNMAIAFSPEARKSRAELDAIHIQIARDIAAAHAQRKKYRLLLLGAKRDVAKNPPELRTYKSEDLSMLRGAEEVLRALTGLTLDRYPAIAPATAGNAGTSAKSIEVPGTLSRTSQAVLRTPQAFPEPEHLKSILDETLSIVFEDIGLTDILDFISSTYEINFNTDIAVTATFPRINLSNISIRDALEALADQHGDIVFVLRDYGIFVTSRDRALHIPGTAIPANVPYVDLNATGPRIKVLGDIPALTGRQP